MQFNDFAKFILIWKPYQDKFKRNVSKIDLQIDFDALSDYELEDIQNALRTYMKIGHFAPVPADIIEIINNEGGKALELEARNFLKKIEAWLDRSFDYVSTDWRGVHAFKETFGNLVNFCNGFDSFSEMNLKKEFVKNYVKSKKAGNLEDNYLIKGIFHNSEILKVRPLESYAEDKAIISQLFAAKKISFQLLTSDSNFKKEELTFNRSELNKTAQKEADELLNKYPSANIDALSDILKKICG